MNEPAPKNIPNLFIFLCKRQTPNMSWEMSSTPPDTLRSVPCSSPGRGQG